MDTVDRLKRLQWRDGARLREWENELAEHRMLQPRKQVYAKYKRLGTTAAVITFLEGKVEWYRQRIKRRAERISSDS